MNPPVNFKIAQLLKELNFNEPSFYSYYDYHGSGKLGDYLSYEYTTPTNVNYLAHKYTAPTIIDTVFWILKKYGYWIYAKPIEHNSAIWQSIIVQGNVVFKTFNKNENQSINSVVEAYEIAIESILKTLINR